MENFEETMQRLFREKAQKQGRKLFDFELETMRAAGRAIDEGIADRLSTKGELK